jgi:hypothetical protein
VKQSPGGVEGSIHSINGKTGKAYANRARAAARSSAVSMATGW